jgi:hypothetical protein
MIDNRNLTIYGNSFARRSLESPERKHFKIHTLRFNSESKYSTPKHLMPKMISSRSERFKSLSIEAIKKKMDAEYQ